MDLSAAGFDGKDRELVLGRKTYEIFEGYWPYQTEDNPIARTFNAAKKHVASRTLKSLRWNNSSVLGGDVVSAVTALTRQPGHDLQIIGSGNLIQPLQAASLIDTTHGCTPSFLAVESDCLKMVQGHVHCGSWLRRFHKLAL